MLKEFAKAVGRKLTGDNILIRETAGTYFKDGKHLRAILLTLYARLMNNIMKRIYHA